MRKCLILTLTLLAFLTRPSQAQVPLGFQFEQYTNEIPAAVTVDFTSTGLIYTMDFTGRVWLFENDELYPDPVIDISEEVAAWGELGALGFALDPDFLVNGYVYLLYVVDHHYLLHYGTPDYNPETTDAYNACMGRLTRFQLDIADYKTLVPDSRTVLYGENLGDGNPVCTMSHGTGDIAFGEDGTLLFSIGDGNTWVNYYSGGDEPIPSFSYDEQAINEGIMDPREHVGAFRSQQIDSYSGKVLRIDRFTGEGLSSNPFFDPNAPDSPRSKVWALGLRNPYRMTLRPGTGSADPAAGNPGTLYITDVGYAEWEEINVADGPGYNFGWPLFEGNVPQPGYTGKYRKNQFIDNPLADLPECNEQHFFFQELIQQENVNHEYHYPNPCNDQSNIADYTIVFKHARPTLAWRNAVNTDDPLPQVPGFDGNGNAVGIPIDNPDLGIENPDFFNGVSGIAGDFYNGTSFPEEYNGAIPLLDYSGWLKWFWFDNNNELSKIEHWRDNMEGATEMRFNPHDETYYVVEIYQSEIETLNFSGNLRPIVEVSPSPAYGTSPLVVEFSTDGTYDPDGDPLTYSWDFGDGDSSDQPNPTHTFESPDDQPFTFTTILTVTDTADNVVQREILVSLNNSPPQVDITSIAEDELYRMEVPTFYELEAAIHDAEHGSGELQYRWDVFLHHNFHYHAVNNDESESSEFVLNPVGCEDLNVYYFRVSIEVTDPEGLTGYDEVYLYPDCEGLLPALLNFSEATLYPNPNSGLFSIGFETEKWKEKEIEFSIFDMQGKRVMQQSILIDAYMRKVDFDLSTLPSGLYTVVAEGPDFKETNKLLITKY